MNPKLRTALLQRLPNNIAQRRRPSDQIHESVPASHQPGMQGLGSKCRKITGHKVAADIRDLEKVSQQTFQIRCQMQVAFRGLSIPSVRATGNHLNGNGSYGPCISRLLQSCAGRDRMVWLQRVPRCQYDLPDLPAAKDACKVATLLQLHLVDALGVQLYGKNAYNIDVTGNGISRLSMPNDVAAASEVSVDPFAIPIRFIPFILLMKPEWMKMAVNSHRIKAFC